MCLPKYVEISILAIVPSSFLVRDGSRGAAPVARDIFT